MTPSSLQSEISDQSQQSVDLSALSIMNKTDFVAALEGIFEHSPWVAEAAWDNRPFADHAELKQALMSAMWNANKEQLLKLICAHPELAGKAAIAGDMTDASINEQANAGLSQCTPEQLATIQKLNKDYLLKFGWPFVIAVRGMNVSSIIDAITTRLTHSAEEEFEQALTQIGLIASLRLEGLLNAGH